MCIELTDIQSCGEKFAEVLLDQKKHNVKRGLYWETQINFAYNSEKIEGNQLNEEQTRGIFETNTLTTYHDSAPVIRADNIIETKNQFRLFDKMLATYTEPLTPELMCEYHRVLKTGTTDDLDNPNFVVGGWKTIPNSIGGKSTVSPKFVQDEIAKLLTAYNSKENKTIEDIAIFHALFEKIHPFQDGNGRIGRIIIFKECLANNICPLVVLDNTKMQYYVALSQFEEDSQQIVEYCKSMQATYYDRFKTLMPE